jgi:hypothetical protein
MGAIVIRTRYDEGTESAEVATSDSRGIEEAKRTHPRFADCKLYHLRLRVECTLFVIYKAGREPTPDW